MQAISAFLATRYSNIFLMFLWKLNIMQYALSIIRFSEADLLSVYSLYFNVILIASLYHGVSFQVGLVLDGAICLADYFEFMMYHCTRLKAFSTIAADKSHSVIAALNIVPYFDLFKLAF